MPYSTNQDLPPAVQKHLPSHAQTFAHRDDPRQEEASHRIAWAAVKRSYVKVGANWINRADLVQ